MPDKKYKILIVCTYFGQRCSGAFDGDFTVVCDRGRDLDGLAGHVRTLVQAYLTLDHTGPQAHRLGQLVIDVAPERFLWRNKGHVAK